MTSVTEVSGAEAKEHGHGTTVPALVLQQIGTVFGAHLSAGHVAASAAHQFRGVVVGAAHVQFAACFAAVVRLQRELWNSSPPARQKYRRKNKDGISV